MEKEVKWWKNAVVYQIYPLSFMDSNGDGIGDLSGIQSKLDYLKNLGVDVIWLSPVYESPMDDNGYDIKNYLAIDKIFGTMEDMKNLIEKTHQMGMRLIMDLVINHTSDEHHWFLESKKSNDNPYRDFYVWRDQPSEIGSVFGGSAWEYDEHTDSYYFHLFSKKQPDLNWDNPKLREKIYAIVNFWLDMGIDGFRLDVIDLIGKDIDQKILSDGPHLKKRLKELYDQCFQGRDIMTVGEMPGLSLESAAAITSGKNPLLDMIFQFSHISLDEIPGKGKWALRPLDLIEFKNVFEKLQTTMFNHGWNSLFLANHDQPRAVSRYGNLAYRVESSKMLATILYGMQGTPYVYQGEEIGMTGVKFDNIDQYKDIETKNIYQILSNQGIPHEEIMASIYAKGRDNSRTPFQWDDSRNAGFSTGNPWLDLNPNYKEINVKKDLSNPDGVYHYFKKLFQIRKSNQVFLDGKFIPFMKDNPELFGYYRKNKKDFVLIIGSFNDQSMQIEIPGKILEVLITNNPTIEVTNKMEIPPYYACILRIKGDQ
ncbi:MAG: alpha-glucosidase [Acholeplasmataceae bacterium]|nr:alpha-glucosidase [Acholeplasmataceae bacterium]